jgi:hypothetical protein
MLVTFFTAIRPDFCVCAFMAIEMFLFMAHAGTKSAFLLHRESIATHNSAATPQGGDEGVCGWMRWWWWQGERREMWCVVNLIEKAPWIRTGRWARRFYWMGHAEN